MTDLNEARRSYNARINCYSEDLGAVDGLDNTLIKQLMLPRLLPLVIDFRLGKIRDLSNRLAWQLKKINTYL